MYSIHYQTYHSYTKNNNDIVISCPSVEIWEFIFKVKSNIKLYNHVLSLKNEIVGVVESLCQDVCGEVRGSMCAQLPPVARGLGLDATKTHILPELVDLCSDEETSVRLAGINTVVLIIPLLDQG